MIMGSFELTAYDPLNNICHFMEMIPCIEMKDAK